MRNKLVQQNYLKNIRCCLSEDDPRLKSVASILMMDMKFHSHSLFFKKSDLDSFILWKPDFDFPKIAGVWNQLLSEMDKSNSSSLPSNYTLSKVQEEKLFLRLNYSKLRLQPIYQIARCGSRTLTDAEVEYTLKWGEMMKDSRDAIAVGNVALILAMGKRYGFLKSCDPNDVISEGCVSLLRAIDRFNVSLGWKFSTYACGAMVRSWARMGQKSTERNGREKACSFEFNLSDFKTDPKLKTDLGDIQVVLGRNIANLNDNEMQVIKYRYFEHSTLEEVGLIVGLTKERVRQIQNEAIDKLKIVMN